MKRRVFLGKRFNPSVFTCFSPAFHLLFMVLGLRTMISNPVGCGVLHHASWCVCLHRLTGAVSLHVTKMKLHFAPKKTTHLAHGFWLDLVRHLIVGEPSKIW